MEVFKKQLDVELTAMVQFKLLFGQWSWRSFPTVMILWFYFMVIGNVSKSSFG